MFNRNSVLPTIKKLVFVAAVAVGLASTANTAQASFVLNFTGANEISGSGGTFTGTVTATFTNATATTVTLTIDASMASGGFMTGFYFNVNGTPSQVGSSGATGPVGATTFSQNDLGTGGNAGTFKADGDGFFDLVYGFPTSGDTFAFGETITFTLTRASGLTEDDFNFLSVGGESGNGNYTAILRAQGLAGGNSGWFAPSGSSSSSSTTGGGPIPEPATIITALSGLPIGLLALRRRLRKQNATN